MTPIAPDVWHVPAAPLRMPGGFTLPLASTVLRLADGSLLVYSPGRFDDQQVADISSLGEVSHIVAPSLYHHLYAGKAAEKWPKAQLHAAPGLSAKRADVKFHYDLGVDVDPSWRGVVDVEVIGGTPKMNEAVLFHRPSGTLVCADFLFNVTKPANTLTRIGLAMTGSGGQTLKQSLMWKMLVKDRAATRASIDRIMTWPIRHISPVHGEPVDIDREHLAPLLTRSYGAMPPIR